MASRRKDRKKSPPAPVARPAAGRRTIAASEFKARCLRILDDVRGGEEVLITKRGEEIARVIPARPRLKASSRGHWKEMVRVTGEIVHSDWSAEFDAAR